MEDCDGHGVTRHAWDEDWDDESSMGGLDDMQSSDNVV